MASQKPDYVLKFAETKPAHTEIKCINGHYYLYECSSRYDPVKKRGVKVSGKMLGKITPEGFVKSERRRGSKNKEPVKEEDNFEAARNMKIPSPRLNSHVEIGFCLYLYAQTEEIRKNLKEFFFEDHFRVMLYAVCLLGVLYSPKPEELEERYWKSLISHIYPSLPLDEDSLLDMLQAIGCMGDCTEGYMEKGISPDGDYALLERHSLLFLVNLQDGIPLYCRPCSEEEDIQNPGINLTVIGTQNRFSELESRGIRCISPWKHEEKTGDLKKWHTSFGFEDRRIYVRSSDLEGRKIHLYFDYRLFSQEMGKLTENTPFPALENRIREMEEESERREESLERAVSARERAERRVQRAEEKFDRVKRKAEIKQLGVEEAVLISMRRRRGTKTQLRLEKACARLKNARERERKCRINLEMEQALLEDKRRTESAAREKAESSLEALDRLRALLITEDGDHPPVSPEPGITALITNRTDPAERIYSWYNLRIPFFDTRDDAPDPEDGIFFNAWLFLNLICSQMAVTFRNTLAGTGCSPEEAATALRGITASREGNTWILDPVSEEAKKLCETLNFDPEAVLHSFDWNYRPEKS